MKIESAIANPGFLPTELCQKRSRLNHLPTVVYIQIGPSEVATI